MSLQSLVMRWAAVLAACAISTTGAAARFMENLDRGVVAVYKGGGQVYIGWRLLGTDPSAIAFNVYRNSVKLNASPVSDSTNYVDSAGSLASTYSVVPVIDGREQTPTRPVSVWGSFCRSITLAPVDGSYTPNDASVGDLDGDGDYEIVLKRLSTDISQTSTTFHLIEAYHLDGTFMWRINLGPNNLCAPEEINPMVYDFDSDGRAEVALRTCEGNVDGTGAVTGDMDDDGKTDYRSSWATPGQNQYFMTEGPEFLSIFDGLTGGEITRTDYIERDPISQWGSAGMSLGQYAHRGNKCMMTPAYIDGQRPSLVICRGIYDRIKMEAWNFRDGVLSRVWSFDTAYWPGYAGQGNHNLSVGDVDRDGKDEIVYASMCVDDDGSGLYTTRLGHGDAMHLSDMIPGRPGLEVFQCHESYPYGTTLRDARTGEILWQKTAGDDTGRCCAAHIDSRYPGYQMWSVSSGGTYNAADNSLISTNVPNWGNFLIWWDGDLQREILDVADSAGHPIINKWWGDSAGRLLSLYNYPTSYSTVSNNGSKGNPCLSGDILGDWREECIYRSSDNTQLRIYTSTTVTSSRLYTLMHDAQYRMAIAWQCNMYNQPPHPSFYMGEGMSPPPQPDIILTGADPDETENPTPNPMGWAVRPYVSGSGAIAMQAASALDPSGVEYYFACTYGGGHDSDWQSSAVYEDTGLAAGVTYTYTVKARDKSNNQNTTLASIPASCTAAAAAGLAYWDFEDGVEGQSFTPSGQANGSGGSHDLRTGVLMRGWDSTVGPSWSSDTLGSGLSMHCANNAQDGYVTEGILHGWSPTAWTIELSVKLIDLSGWNTLIGRDGSSQGEAESDFYLQNNGIDDRFRINFDTVGGRRWVLDGNYIAQPNKWYRLAVTSDGVTLKMYLDDGTGYAEIGSLNISAQSVAANALPGTALNWTFGRGWHNGSFVDRINGWMDNIRFSNGALAPDQLLGAPSAQLPWLYGDFTGNAFVNYEDFAVFSELLSIDDCQSLSDFDLNGDCMIDLHEFAKMADHWLLTN